jgi:uncharacterized membrane protein (GlpM family)
VVIVSKVRSVVLSSVVPVNPLFSLIMWYDFRIDYGLVWFVLVLGL